MFFCFRLPQAEGESFAPMRQSCGLYVKNEACLYRSSEGLLLDAFQDTKVSFSNQRSGKHLEIIISYIHTS